MVVEDFSRIGNQKLNQTLAFGWVFGFQLDSLDKQLITLTIITFTHDEIGTYWLVAASAKGRNEHQKLNQMAQWSVA